MNYQLIDKPGKYEYKVGRDEEIGVIMVGLREGKYEIRLVLEGEGAKGYTAGVIKTKGREKMVVRTETIHKSPNTHARTVVHGIADGAAILDISGMIKIFKGADRVTDFLTEKVLLLSDEAKALATPGLEIEADEVRASHAATVAKIDEEQLFYLTQRGLTKKEAEKMIAEGFLMAVAEKIKDDKMRKKVEELICLI